MHRLAVRFRFGHHLAVMLSALIACVGCERGDVSASHDDAGDRTPAAPMLWAGHGCSLHVALAPEDHDEALAAAMDEARQSAESARLRWENAPAADRSRWAVKWAAPTIDGRVEHVWVVPDSWTAYRIEGRLATSVVTRLECGAQKGDRVSFASSGLADWMHLPTADPAGLREGGFTVAALEARFGRPQPPQPGG